MGISWLWNYRLSTDFRSNKNDKENYTTGQGTDAEYAQDKSQDGLPTVDGVSASHAETAENHGQNEEDQGGSQEQKKEESQQGRGFGSLGTGYAADSKDENAAQPAQDGQEKGEIRPFFEFPVKADGCFFYRFWSGSGRSQEFPAI